MYREVLPAKDHQAVICSIHQMVEEEIDGQVLIRLLSEEHVDLASAAAAALWTDTHITFTPAERSEISRVELEREVFESFLSLCPPGHKVEVQFQDEECYNQAHLAADGHLIDEESVKWVNIRDMVLLVGNRRSRDADREKDSMTSRDS
jgi:hypothetical protein